MPCARGCCATQREHYQSIGVASSGRFRLTKTRIDDHGPEGTVEVTEHWHDRQDVLARPATLRVQWGGAPRG